MKPWHRIAVVLLMLAFSLLSWAVVLYSLYSLGSWVLAAWSTWAIVRFAVVIGGIGFGLFLLSEHVAKVWADARVRR